MRSPDKDTPALLNPAICFHQISKFIRRLNNSLLNQRRVRGFRRWTGKALANLRIYSSRKQFLSIQIVALAKSWHKLWCEAVSVLQMRILRNSPPKPQRGCRAPGAVHHKCSCRCQPGAWAASPGVEKEPTPLCLSGFLKDITGFEVDHSIFSAATRFRTAERALETLKGEPSPFRTNSRPCLFSPIFPMLFWEGNPNEVTRKHGFSLSDHPHACPLAAGSQELLARHRL